MDADRTYYPNGDGTFTRYAMWWSSSDWRVIAHERVNTDQRVVSVQFVPPSKGRDKVRKPAPRSSMAQDIIEKNPIAAKELCEVE